MSSWLTTSGSVWKFNGSVMASDAVDPLNPLGLPPFTIRCYLTGSERPEVGDSQTLVYQHPIGVYSIWDITKNSTDWTNLFANVQYSWRLKHILGANTTGVVCMRQTFLNTGIMSACLFDTSSVEDMVRMFAYANLLSKIPLYDTSRVKYIYEAFLNCFLVESGALALYRQASSQANPPLDYRDAFSGCATGPASGRAERAQIPQAWGGDYVDPLNPLDLPPYTIRCKFPLGEIPNIGDSRSLVEYGDDYFILDITKESRSWRSLFGQYAGDLLEVLGANSTGVSDMSFLFDGAYRLTTVPLFDTSRVESMSCMFRGVPELGDQGSSLRTVPLFNTGLVENFSGMFQNAVSLTSLPTFNTYAARNLSYMMAGCKSLRVVPWFHTDTVENMAYMCAGCQTIQDIPLLNTWSVVNMQSAFHGCSAVRTGALALYQQASGQAHPPRNHVQTFADCGSGNPAGAAELAEIPSDWK